ncbi:helix-turn-helix transcriptional regulator [Arenibacterium halophilum]|uniref:Helix-turn-helix domain-containing protein n=1 Tax=Arenibacterium halophilum TaxID=2583821 RepID=A0ABY2XCQ0_9RHOB|nr:helix-turn-helix domain-containing protein [Arenibacterium halophilum]TMV14433.1 helix-turn-helix domain-containing protein [Arenibacterium halophilum]
MKHFQPICVRETRAAQLLDLTSKEFRDLVSKGALPRPVRVGGFDRWRVSDLEAILNGDAALPSEDIEL